MSERITRELGRRVVSTRVLGSSNPVARWGRGSQKTCLDSFGGFFLGLLLFCITFALPYCAATVEKDSKDIKPLKEIYSDKQFPTDGKVLLRGPLLATNAPSPPLDNRPDKDKFGYQVIAYHHTVELWQTHQETHEETRTETRNGQDVEVKEQVTEDVSEWVTESDNTRWAQLMVGSVAVDPSKVEMDLPWQEVYRQETPQKRREIVNIVINPPDVLLAAELAGGQIAPDPDFAELTIKTKAELVADWHAKEETGRWLLIALSVILWTVSINLIVGPAMVLFNIFPIQAVGCALRSLIGLCAFIVACALTAVMYISIRYWWAVLIGIGAIIWLLVAVIKRGKPGGAGAGAGGPAPA